MLLDLKPIALKCEIDSEKYWDMSLDDIAESIQAYNRKCIEENQIKAYISYTQACMTAIAFHEPKKLPSDVAKAYPVFFKDINNDTVKGQDWRELKAYMQSFSKHHNNKVRKGGI